MPNESLISLGGAVKAIKTEGDLVTLGGYLVTFGDPSTADLEGDYFTANTNYGAHKGNGVDVLFHHGLPLPIPQDNPELAAKTAQIADQIYGTVETTLDEIGLFGKVVLNMADQYQCAVANMGIAGKLGWSSGAPAHAVRYKGGAKSGEIERWFIAEASLTPTPCDTRNFGTVLPVKAWLAQEAKGVEPAIKSVYLGDFTETDLTCGVVSSLYDRLRWHVLYDIFEDVADGEMDKSAARARLEGALNEVRDITLKVYDAIVGGESEQTPTMAAKFLKAKKENDGEGLLAGLTNAELTKAALAAAKSLPARAQAIKTAREAENRKFPSEAKRAEIEGVIAGFETAIPALKALINPEETSEAVKSVIPDERFLAQMSRIAARSK